MNPWVVNIIIISIISVTVMMEEEGSRQSFMFLILEGEGKETEYK